MNQNIGNNLANLFNMDFGSAKNTGTANNRFALEGQGFKKKYYGEIYDLDESADLNVNAMGIKKQTFNTPYNDPAVEYLEPDVNEVIRRINDDVAAEIKFRM